MSRDSAAEHGWLTEPIDWLDIAVAVVVGVIVTVLKVIAHSMPEWGLGGIDALVASVIVIGYIIYRARHQPEKLDEWGLATAISAKALAVIVIFTALAAAVLAGTAVLAGGTVSFEIAYLPRMVDYIPGAFPQQFFMCSVGLVTLAKLRPLQGRWRLPLIVGLVFGIAHFWTPSIIPGTRIPMQVVGTIPVGFLAAWYFLRFRTIVPLTACHAILYVLLNQWVEAHL